jgi:hypothetical protein
MGGGRVWNVWAFLLALRSNCAGWHTLGPRGGTGRAIDTIGGPPEGKLRSSIYCTFMKLTVPDLLVPPPAIWPMTVVGPVSVGTGTVKITPYK